MDDLVYRYDPGTNRLRQVDDRSIAATDAYGWDADSSWFAYNANGAMTWQSVRRDGRSDLRLQAWTDERDLPIAVTVRDPGFQVGLDYRYDAAGLRTYRRQMPLPAEQQNEHLPGGGSYRVERYLRDGAAVLGVLDGEGRLVHWNLHGRGPVGGGTFGRLEPVAQDPPDAAQLTGAAETAAGAAVDASLEHALLTAGVSERDLDLVIQALFYDPTAPLSVSEASTAVVAVVGPALLAAEALGGLVVADRAGAETHERSVLALEALLLDAMVAAGVELADQYAPDAAQVLAGEAARAVAAVVAEALDTSGQPLVRRYYVADHLGSVRAVVDTTGSVVEGRDYAPWGLVMPGRVYVQGSETREGFTGHELDRETGLVYAGARYYLPALGRWTSVDPLAAKHPSWSSYNYSINSPVNYVDPDGLDPITFFIRAANSASRWRQVSRNRALRESRSRGDVRVQGTAESREARRLINDAHPGQRSNIRRHDGHTTPDGRTGMPHYQHKNGGDRLGHVFYGEAAKAALAWSIVEILIPIEVKAAGEGSDAGLNLEELGIEEVDWDSVLEGEGFKRNDSTDHQLPAITDQNEGI